MYKYLSALCAFIGVVLFYSRPMPYSAWISLVIIVIGTILGTVSLKKEPNSFGKFSLVINIAILVVFLSGLFVRIFIWNRP